MTKNINKKIAKYLVSYINSNELYTNLFKHHKQVYGPQKLFEALLYKLETGIAYNNICSSKCNIKGGTLFYFHKKLIKDIFNLTTSNLYLKLISYNIYLSHNKYYNYLL